MKTKAFLLMMIAILMLSVPVFAEEKCIKGLAPMAAEGLWTAATHLDEAVVAVATRPHEVVWSGMKGVYIASDAVVRTAGTLLKGGADGIWTAVTHLDVAVIAVATEPHKVVWKSAKGICKGGDAIVKCVFGNCK